MTHKLYEHKPLKVGFVVLCHICDVWQAKTTINSLKYNYPGCKHICVIPAGCTKKEIINLAPTFEGGDTVTSLLNVGLENAPCEEWNFVIVARSWLHALLDKKFSYFVESDNDILYPVIGRKLDFIDANINGLFIKKKIFKEVGPFPEEPMDHSKALWSDSALSKGCRFKGILGTPIY